MELEQGPDAAPPKIVAALKADPEALARVELAIEMGRAPRVLEGWAPTLTIDGNKITSEPEFDLFESELIMAAREIRGDRCPGCHGSLSETTVDDHGYRIHEKICQKCRAIDIYNERKDKEQQYTKGTELESPSAARRLWTERVELPPADDDASEV